ncbi:tRNA (adenosine(37)-N6)-threonylcarbamoyltransferase complex transferase subunit TsaD [Candidatus Parcubacteria bacterium]|nr:tRNA (adenosine(37)-N6)-threonylcarbamoyltransferase complex transferase subunit TsaD [Candidatus Parcubacteria bacterium]
MKILAIETSCDETAISIIEASGAVLKPEFKVLGNAVLSQIIHKEYGGVYPNLAKREHEKNLIPIFEKVLKEAKLFTKSMHDIDNEALEKILVKEPELFKHFIEFIGTIDKPDIDYIAVTSGPGLEPALWVGIKFAEALSHVWNISVLPINHMEGHIASVLYKNTAAIEFPALALLISGGHTELVLAKKWGKYEILGQTRDDAVGEAFDKVARLLGLPYPGGPEISKLAAIAREKNLPRQFELPRPMIKSDDFDFSFSGIKTAVLYTLKKIGDVTQEIREDMSREFEDAVTEVLIAKTEKALETHAAKSLILGGGVIANTHIRSEFEKLILNYPDVRLNLPAKEITTDNALMIALAAFVHLSKGEEISTSQISAEGNLKL